MKINFSFGSIFNVVSFSDLSTITNSKSGGITFATNAKRKYNVLYKRINSNLVKIYARVKVILLQNDFTTGRFPRPAPGCSPLPTRFARPPHHQQGKYVYYIYVKLLTFLPICGDSIDLLGLRPRLLLV